MSADYMKLSIRDAWGNNAHSPTPAPAETWANRTSSPATELSPYRTPVPRPVSPVSPRSKSACITRARSVPASLRNKHNLRAARPNTVATTSKPECSRLYQVEHESTRKHILEAHLPTRKSKAPPWQTKLDATPVPVVVSPSYTMAKSKNKIVMTIKTDSFFEEPQQETVSNKQLDPESSSLIGQLQQQIDDLTLFLEEERINHKDTKRKAADLLRDQIDSLQNQHANTVRSLEEKHKEEVDEVREDYEKLILENQKYFDKNNINPRTLVCKMKGEIDFLQGAFESYKSKVLQETDIKWAKKTSEMESEHQKELDRRLKELKSRMLAEHNHEKSTAMKDTQTELAQTKRDHKKEIDALTRRYANHAADQKRLEEACAKLAKLEAEHKEMTEDYDNVCRQLALAASELADTKLHLLGFEKNFEQKIQEVDDKYKSQMHELMTQNAEIRRQYVKKCEQLFNEKAAMEETRSEKLGTAKEAMKKRLEEQSARAVEEEAAAKPASASQSQQDSMDHDIMLQMWSKIQQEVYSGKWKRGSAKARSPPRSHHQDSAWPGAGRLQPGSRFHYFLDRDT